MCHGKKWRWIDDPKSRFVEKPERIKTPCEFCNGKGKVTVAELKCIAKKLADEKFELECQLSKLLDKNDGK